MSPNISEFSHRRDGFDCIYTRKAIATEIASTIKDDNERIVFAKTFCRRIIDRMWHLRTVNKREYTPLRYLDDGAEELAEFLQNAADDIGLELSADDLCQSSYAVGTIYTALLPPSYRSAYGSYYTPPFLVNRLLDAVEKAGVMWSTVTVIDPACGGGAFLMPVISRMLTYSSGKKSETVNDICNRVHGQEVDPFAAWLSQVFIDMLLLTFVGNSSIEIPVIVDIKDSLLCKNDCYYDLVIGNPPYGRIGSDQYLRDKFSRSIFGHANKYGLFTDLAVRLAKPGGVIGYVTPTSYLSGQYFKALRMLLYTEAPLHSVDFVTDREGIFDDVLQETALSVFKKNKKDRFVTVSEVSPDQLDNNRATVNTIGRYVVPKEKPWLLPRSVSQTIYLVKCKRMKTRLVDIGYSVSTGPLVWNRHKEQLRQACDKTATYPIVWAESVAKQGFELQATKRNHAPFIELIDGQEHLLTQNECVLLQRTTSKEQEWRIIAAVMPQEEIDRHGAMVVENHVNMIYAHAETPIEATTVAFLLNSKTVDMLVRCICGSVAVSAYELNSIPLPNQTELLILQDAINSYEPHDRLESMIMTIYGVEVNEQTAVIIAS